MRHDLAIRGGLVATATETFHADIGIRDGRIATLAESITDADDVIDATGRIVMPGRYRGALSYRAGKRHGRHDVG